MISSSPRRGLMTVFAWLSRRLALPALAAAPVVTAALLIVLGIPSLLHSSIGEAPSLIWTGLSEAPFIAAVAAIWIAPSLLCFGIPAGYLVARLGFDFQSSLAILVLVGALGGPLLMTYVFSPGAITDMFDPELFGTFGLAGSVTAAVWGMINRDLFRRR